MSSPEGHFFLIHKLFPNYSLGVFTKDRRYWQVPPAQAPRRLLRLRKFLGPSHRKLQHPFRATTLLTVGAEGTIRSSISPLSPGESKPGNGGYAGTFIYASRIRRQSVGSDCLGLPPLPMP